MLPPPTLHLEVVPQRLLDHGLFLYLGTRGDLLDPLQCIGVEMNEDGI